MVYIKTAICLVLFFIVGLFSYMYVAFDADHELEIALDAYLKEDYLKAEMSLLKLENAIPKEKLYLYQSYIYRQQGRLVESNNRLEQAAITAQRKSSGAYSNHSVISQSILNEDSPEMLLLEINLNRCLNAYKENDPQRLTTAVDESQRLFPNNAWVIFFSALELYWNGDYTNALNQWANAPHKLPLSDWMSKSFQEHFTSSWEPIHIARCQVEDGKYLLARQLLEQRVNHPNNEEKEMVNLIKGISYIKEAEQKPIGAATSYYKLAFSHFERIPILQQRFYKERTQVVAKIKETVNSLINNRSFKELPFYLGVLNDWNVKIELQEITTNLLSLIDEEIENANLETVEQITSVVNRVIQDDSVREELESYFVNLIKKSINGGETQYLEFYWKIADEFSFQPIQLKQEITDMLTGKVLRLIEKIPNDLDAISSYIAFWQSIETDKQRRLDFARELTKSSQEVWLTDGQESQAEELMKLSISLPYATEQKELKDTLEQTVNNVYVVALENNNSTKLSHLLEVVKTFDLPSVQMEDKSLANDYLAEAEDFFKVKRYEEAKKRIDWVKQLAPDDERVLKLSGFIDYQLGKFQEALDNLSKLEMPDKKVQEIKAICQYILSEKQEKEGFSTLSRLEEKYGLDQETYLKLAFASLMREEPRAAKEWFEQVSYASDVIDAGLCFSAYEMKEWEQALEYYNKLSKPYNQLFGYQGIAIKCMIELGQNEEAEKRINHLLQKTVEPSIATSPYVFQMFKKEKLDSLNRYFIAGVFFKRVKQDQNEAIRFFMQIKNPSPQTLYERGNAFIGLGLLKKAAKDLVQVERLGNTKLSSKASAQLGKIFAIKGHYFEAAKKYKEYLTNFPSDIQRRIEYADALIKQRRFSEALEQFVTIKKSTDLPDAYRVPYLTTLIHSDYFSEAVNIAHKWLKEKPSLPMKEQLQIARLMVITRANQLVEDVIGSALNDSILSIDEQKEFIHLLIDNGNYKNAMAIAEMIKDDLQGSADGLMVLARINQSLGEPGDALTFSKMALGLDKNHIAAREYVSLNEANPKEILTNLKVSRKKSEKRNRIFSEKISYFKHLDNALICTKSQDEPFRRQLVSYAKDAVLSLDKLSRDFEQQPEVFYLLGRMSFVAGENQRAVDAFEKAIKLDESYAEANKNLGMIYLEEKQFGRASQQLVQVNKYSPSDSESLLALSSLFLKKRDFYEAKEILYQTIKYNPNEVDAYVLLGKVLLEMGNPEDSMDIVEKALEITPKNENALKVMMVALFDKTLFLSTNKEKHVFEQKKSEIYRRLYEENPREAKKLLAQLSPDDEMLYFEPTSEPTETRVSEELFGY